MSRVSTPAPAPTPQERRWRLSAMTWPEVEEAARRSRVVVIPTGSIEQHGPHLPVDTDTRLATTICERAVAELADEIGAVLAPTIPFGASTLHTRFPGTIDIGTDLFIALAVRVGKELIRSGFDRLLFLNGHGGNHAPLLVAAEHLHDAGARVVAVTNHWTLAAQDINAWRRSAPGGISHAGELETSLYLAIDETAVRTDRIPRELEGTKPRIPQESTDLVIGGAVRLTRRMHELSPSGVLGAPRYASTERGREILEREVERLKELIRELHALG